jgi:hypothetical protein
MFSRSALEAGQAGEGCPMGTPKPPRPWAPSEAPPPSAGTLPGPERCHPALAGKQSVSSVSPCCVAPEAGLATVKQSCHALTLCSQSSSILGPGRWLPALTDKLKVSVTLCRIATRLFNTISRLQTCMIYNPIVTCGTKHSSQARARRLQHMPKYMYMIQAKATATDTLHVQNLHLCSPWPDQRQ